MRRSKRKPYKKARDQDRFSASSSESKPQQAATEPQLPRWYLVVIACTWSGVAFCAALLLEDLSPLLSSLPLASMLVAANVVFWVLLGGEPLVTAHLLVTQLLSSSKRWLWGGAVVPILLLGLLVPIVWYQRPVRKLSNLLLGEAKSEDPPDFFPECLTIEPMPTSSSSITGRLLNQFSNGCSEIPLDRLVEQSRPLLVLGDPATGKLYLLRKLRAELGGHGIPSLLIRVRDCRGITLAACVGKRIDEASRKLFYDQAPPKIAQDDQEVRSWWLFVDGIDDDGDESEVIGRIRELLSIQRVRGSHIVVNGRSQFLSYLFYRQGGDDELRRFLATFQRIGLKGLTEQASEEMIQSLAAQNKNPHLVRKLEAMRYCKGEAGVIARDVVSLPALLRSFSEYHENTPIPLDCTPASQHAVASWMLGKRFEAFCRVNVCGSDDRKNFLRDLWSREIVLLLAYPSDRIDRRAVVKNLKGDPTTYEDVIRALIETGPLIVNGYNEFHIEHEWLSPSS